MMNKPEDNQINPDKLLLSKWTAVKPQHKEKHFLVTRIIKNEQTVVVACILEAVFSGREYELDRRALNEDNRLTGWR